MTLTISRPVKYLLGGMFSILLLLSTLLALLFTPITARWASELATSSVPALTLTYSKGSLTSQLEFSRVSWQQSPVNLTISDLKIAFDWQCLRKLSLCLTSVTTANAQVIITESATSKNESSQIVETQGTSDFITSPIPIEIRSIELGPLDVALPGNIQLTLAALSSALSFHQQLVVSPLVLSDLRIQLPKTEDVDEPFHFSQLQNWQYQPPSLPNIHLPLAVSLKQVKVDQTSIVQAGQPEQRITHLNLNLQAQSEQITLDQLAFEHEQASITANLHAKLSESYPLSLALQVRQKTSPQWQLTLDAKGSLSNLQLESRIQNRDAQQSTAQLSARADLLDSNLPLELQTHWQLQAITVKQNRLTSQGHLDIKGNLQQLALALTAENQLSGQTPVEAKIHSTLTANRQTLNIDALNLITNGGTISAHGEATLGDTLGWHGHITLEHINPGIWLDDYPADISGSLETLASMNANSWQLKLPKSQLNGTLRSLPFSLQTQLTSDSQQGTNIDQLLLENGDNQVSLSGTISSQQQLNLQGKILLPALAQSIAHANGRIDGEFHLLGTLDRPDITSNVQLSELSYEDWFLKQAQLSLKASLDPAAPLQLNLQLNELTRSQQPFVHQVTTKLNGSLQSHQLSLNIQGEDSRAQVTLNGGLSVAEGQWQAQVTDGNIATPLLTLELSNPFSILADWQQQQYQLGDHCWQQNRSRFCIAQTYYQQNQAKWQIAIENLAVSPLIQPWLRPTKLTTATILDGKMTGHWSLGNLPEAQATFSLSPENWQFTNAKKQTFSLGLEQAQLDVSFDQQQITLNSTLVSPELGNFNTRLETSPSPGVRPLSGEISLRHFTLHPLLPLLPNIDTLEGSIEGQIALSGSLEQPDINGELRIKDGALSAAGLPLSINQWQQLVTLTKQQALLDGTFRLGEGQGSIKGKVQWLPELIADIGLQGNNLEFDYQSMLRAKVSPDITFKMSPALMDIAGTVTVPWARFKLRELPDSAISPSSDVVMLNDQSDATSVLQQLHLGIQVNIDPARTNQVKLDAFGLTANVNGSLSLNQQEQGMQGQGEINLMQGRYRAYGQNLLIRQGEILFNGALDSPYLNIEAIRDPKLTNDDVVAGIRVSGNIQAPDVSLFSDPSMDQQQNLSYLLRGRSLDSSGDQKQDSMFASLLLGYGLGKSENTVGKLGRSLGIEDLNLDTSGQGDGTQVALSGYIADGVQLRYGVGLDSSSEVTLRYELLPRLYLEAVSGVSNALDVYYQFSIENKD